jgi:hypothetical protein
MRLHHPRHVYHLRYVVFTSISISGDQLSTLSCKAPTLPKVPATLIRMLLRRNGHVHILDLGAINTISSSPAFSPAQQNCALHNCYTLQSKSMVATSALIRNGPSCFKELCFNCYRSEATVTVPSLDSSCTATAVTARSQHYCSCSQSRTTISPAS